MEAKKAQTKKRFVSFAEARPDLVKEWNYKKNGNLKPEDVSYGSDKKVWWLLHYTVPNDYPIESLRGRHFDFEWQAKIYYRNEHPACPYLAGHSIWIGFNDLQSISPELAKQWHPTKNGNLKPSQIAVNADRKIWWLYPYDDPVTGKHFDFEWQASVYNRFFGHTNCPYISGQSVWEGFNDLQTINPELAKQWHPTKNKNLKPTQITAKSNKKVWWFLPYDDPVTGKHFDFEWQAIIKNRNQGSGCVYLTGKAVLEGFNDLATINPELAAQWHPTKNGDLKPTQFTSVSGKKVWWLCPYDDPITGKHFNFEWKVSIDNRAKGSGCPYLTTYKGEEYVMQYLQRNGLIFCKQKKFQDLYGLERQLSYDFALPSKEYGYVLIEYNGIQHYEPVSYFGGASKFKKQKNNDELKHKYAKQHGYKLITIKYTYDTYEKIAEYLDKHLTKEDCKKAA